MTPTDVAQLMDELLHTDDFASDDNFFDLGGTSVLALRLLLELDKRYGVRLSLLDVMYNPTPEGLAGKLAEARAGSAATAGAQQPGEPA
jgi:acyl carrier protein